MRSLDQQFAMAATLITKTYGTDKMWIVGKMWIVDLSCAPINHQQKASWLTLVRCDTRLKIAIGFQSDDLFTLNVINQNAASMQAAVLLYQENIEWSVLLDKVAAYIALEPIKEEVTDVADQSH